MTILEKIIREDLKNFTSYSSARSESAMETSTGRIWLNANESPWSEASEITTKNINRYPEQQPAKLINVLSSFYQVKKDQLVITRGSDEAIDLLIRLCCEQGRDQIITCSPTFGMYEVYGKLQGVEVIDVPLTTNDFQCDLNKLKERLDENSNIKIIFLCSPNNPTGNLLNQNDIFSLCKATQNRCLIVVDEAYIEYASKESLSKYIGCYNNLIILRTLSKAFGLAGARVGALIGNNSFIECIKKIVPPYPLPTPSIEIALEELKSSAIENVFNKILIIQKERDRVTAELESLPIVKSIWPSEANFLLIRFRPDIAPLLNSAKITIRNMESKFKVKNIFRITIGTFDENSTLINSLKQIACFQKNNKERFNEQS